MAEAAKPAIGHNTPDPAPEINKRLGEDYAALKTRVSDLQDRAGKLPKRIKTDADHDQYVACAKEFRAAAKDAESYRVAEKDPYLRSERAVDAFFGALIERLSQTSTAMNKTLKAFLDEKAEAERRKREAEAARLRAEQQRLADEAAERERKAAEARRVDHRAAHEGKAAVAAHQAEQIGNLAHVAERKAEAAPADLARTRSVTAGGMSTLKSNWTHEIEDKEMIPLDLLRAYIPDVELNKAIARFVKMGGRELKGVRIYQETSAVVI